MTSRKAIKAAFAAKDYVSFKKCLEDTPSLVSDDFVIRTANMNDDKMFASILAMKMRGKDVSPSIFEKRDKDFLKNRRQKFLAMSDNKSQGRIESRRVDK